ncbi:MAG: carbohydrate kinase family protein [Spirochaetales bacterium]|nr:carbohydrate kinase family protein [Spirochaetales bacterium]
MRFPQLTANLFKQIRENLPLQAKVLYIGGFNQDIQMQPGSRLIQGDSVPGTVFKTAGGVVRNICENAALLGVNSSLMSICGDDEAGNSIICQTEKSGVDCRHCSIVPDRSTSIYSALLNSDGEMLYAVNQMDLMEEMTPSFFESRLQLLQKFDYFVLDANLSSYSLEWICQNFTGKILLSDPVSTVKFKRLKGNLEHIRMIKPNSLEASSYTGIDLVTERDYWRACDVFLKEGVEKVFISCGERGIFYMDSESSALIPSLELNPVSVTGAGDSASAALILGELSGLSSKETAILANLSGAASLLSSRAINENMSVELLESISKEYNYEKQLS